MDFSRILNGISDQELRSIIKGLPKAESDIHNEAFSKLNEYISKNKDFSSAFAGSVCEVLDICFQCPQAHIRKYSVETARILCESLGKEKVDFAPLILPHILLLSGDSDASTCEAAESALKTFFPTQERIEKMIKIQEPDISARITTLVGELRSNSIRSESWSNVCSCCIRLCSRVGRTLCGDGENISYVFELIDIKSLLKIEHGSFNRRSTPSVRAAVYELIKVATENSYNLSDYGDCLEFIKYETDTHSQITLLSLYEVLINNNILSRINVKKALLESIGNFEDPEGAKLSEFINFFHDEEYKISILSKAVEIPNILIAGRVFKLVVDDCEDGEELNNFLADTFVKAIATKDRRCFLGTCDLAMFSKVANNKKVTEPLKKSRDPRIIRFLKFAGKDVAEKWLRNHTRITPDLLIKYMDIFGGNSLRSIYPTLASIPFGTEEEQNKDDEEEDEDDDLMDDFIVKKDKKKKGHQKKNVGKSSNEAKKKRSSSKMKWGKQKKLQNQDNNEEEDDEQERPNNKKGKGNNKGKYADNFEDDDFEQEKPKGKKGKRNNKGKYADDFEDEEFEQNQSKKNKKNKNKKRADNFDDFEEDELEQKNQKREEDFEEDEIETKQQKSQKKNKNHKNIVEPEEDENETGKNSVINYDDDVFIKFLSLYANKSDIEELSENTSKGLFKLLKIWERPLDPFRSELIHQHAIEFLEKDITLFKKFNEIFPDDPEIKESIVGVVLDDVEQGIQVDDELLGMVKPDDDFIESFLLSDSVKGITKDHPLLPNFIEFVNSHIADMKPDDAAVIAADLVEFGEVDVKEFGFKFNKYPEFYMSFYGYLGYDTFPDEDICEILDSYITKRMHWIDVDMYCRSINWQSIPADFWEYLKISPYLYEVAHNKELLYAMACITEATKVKSHGDDALSIIASLSAPPRKLKTNNDDIIDLQIEWHQVRIPTPDFREYPDIHSLKRTVTYVKQNIPALSTFDPIIPYLEKALEDPTRLSFYLVIKIMALISDAAKDPMDLTKLCKLLINASVKLAPFPVVVEEEMEPAFKLFKLIQYEDFIDVMCDSVNSIVTSSNTQIMNYIMPLMEYFNAWEIVETRFNGKLNLDDSTSWIFITICLKAMPNQLRQRITESLEGEVPKLINNLPYDSKEFEQIIVTFPNAANKWADKLSRSEKEELYDKISKRTTPHVFKQIKAAVLKKRLEGTTYKFDHNKLSIVVSYKQDESSGSIHITLTLPRAYPFGKVVAKADCGDRELEKECVEHVLDNINISQSIEQGIISWHSFIFNYILEGSPCIICYSYLDRGCAPSEMCQICGNKFHKHCLHAWFARCKTQTCPYCGLKWKK